MITNYSGYRILRIATYKQSQIVPRHKTETNRDFVILKTLYRIRFLALLRHKTPKTNVEYIMIKIKEQDDNLTVITAAVTDFTDTMGYCEYKIPLSIAGRKPRQTQSLILGTRAHTAEERYEKEHVKLEPVTEQQIKDKQTDIEFARENVYSTLTVPFEFPTTDAIVSLSGRIDKIARVDQTLTVQDDKFVARPESYDNKAMPYPGQLLQVLAYLNSNYSVNRDNDSKDVFHMPNAQKRWIIRICDRNTREPYRIYSDIQNKQMLHYLHASLERFAKIALGIDSPKHHNSKAKCNACSLKHCCEYKIEL